MSSFYYRYDFRTLSIDAVLTSAYLYFNKDKELELLEKQTKKLIKSSFSQLTSISIDKALQLYHEKNIFNLLINCCHLYIDKLKNDDIMILKKASRVDNKPIDYLGKGERNYFRHQYRLIQGLGYTLAVRGFKTEMIIGLGNSLGGAKHITFRKKGGKNAKK